MVWQRMFDTEDFVVIGDVNTNDKNLREMDIQQNHKDMKTFRGN